MNKIILKGQTSFVPSHIFECGQAFRWKKLDEEAYRFIFRDMVLEARSIDDSIEILTMMQLRRRYQLMMKLLEKLLTLAAE